MDVEAYRSLLRTSMVFALAILFNCCAVMHLSDRIDNLEQRLEARE
jgi:hypothetical protein